MIVSMLICCFVIISFSWADDDPCLPTNHIALNDSGSTGTYVTSHAIQVDDSGMSWGWYQAAPGSIGEQPWSSITAQSCSGNNLWVIDDDLPTAGYTDNVTMCVYKCGFFSCFRTWEISLKNCETFYVYKLTSPCSGYCNSYTVATTKIFYDTTATIASPSNETEEDPCLPTNHVSLDDEWRSTNNTYSYFFLTRHCDSDITEAWYRVTPGTLGNIATSDPGIRVCGTSYPIWMNDDLPSDGATRTVNVCVRTIFSSCHRTWTIRVKECATFYVYELYKPPSTFFDCAAYCFDPASNTSTSTVLTNTDISSSAALTDPAINTSSSTVLNNTDNTSSSETLTDFLDGSMSTAAWIGLILGIIYVVLIIHAGMAFLCSEKHVWARDRVGPQVDTENDLPTTSRGIIKVKDMPKTRNTG